MKSIAFHNYANLFPIGPEHEIDELLERIKKRGLRQRIILYKGKILDGRRRYLACRKGKIEPRYVEGQFKSDADALEYVWDLNFHRRNLNESQSAIAAAKYATLSQGQRANSNSSRELSQAQAAKVSGTSVSTIKRAKQVLKYGTKKHIKDVSSGKTTVSAAVRAIDVAGSGGNGADSPVTDAMGYPVPVAARPYWDRKTEAETILKAIRSVKKQVKALRSDDPMWVEVNLNGVLSDLDNAANRFSSGVPAYVCVYCQGATPDKCTVCKGRGVVSKFLWDVAVPDEMKRLREKAIK